MKYLILLCTALMLSACNSNSFSKEEWDILQKACSDANGIIDEIFTSDGRVTSARCRAMSEK